MSIFLHPLSDETIDSFLMRLAACNGHPPPNIQYLKKTNAAWKSGARPDLRKFVVPGLGGERRMLENALTQSSSFAPFFRPFLERPRLSWDQCASEESDLGYEYCPTIFRFAIRTTPALCPVCTTEDFRQFGLSYWRRNHQIVCNRICNQHRVFLITGCSQCGEAFQRDQLPAETCLDCDQNLVSNALPVNSSSTSDRAFLRIAKCVSDIFDGTITQSLSVEKLASIVESTIVCRTPRFYNNAARQITSTIGQDILSELNLHPGKPPNFGWPAKYLNRSWRYIDPMMELILFGVFGDQLSIDQAWRRGDDAWIRKRADHWRSLDLSILKVTYKADSYEAAAESIGAGEFYLRTTLRSYPGLVKRIGRFRVRRKARIAQRGSR